jgi:hypothetical protein
MVVGHRFSAAETISALTVVLKEAFLAYGIPKRLYVDNGPSFSSELLAKSCALAGISLIHSKPYDSPSRGKVERFFRTVRERFLSGLQPEVSLQELDQIFWIWLQEDYHHKLHNGIDAKPIDRYNASPGRIELCRLSKSELRHPFDDPQELYLYDSGVRVGKIKLLDKKENARSFRPQRVPTRLSFHKEEVRP